MKNVPKKAVTLIELLCVAAIVITLTAIMLPAVQSARESARRATCANHLRQVGLALYSYHDLHRSLPISASNAIGGWTVACLKHLEGGAAFDAFDHSESPLTDHNLTVAAKNRPPVYQCPSSTNSPTGAYANVPACHFTINSELVGRRIPLGNSSQVFLLQELPNEAGFLAPWTLEPSFPVLIPGESSELNHLNGANVLFLDSHVSFVSAGDD